MGARSRSRNRAAISAGRLATYVNGVFSGSTPGATGVTDRESCSDSTQPWPFTAEQNLSLTRNFARPLIITGSGNTGANTEVVAENYNPTNKSLYSFCPAVSAGESTASLTTRALANLNPSNPRVDIPLFLFELKDLPRMIRQLGDVLKGKYKPSDVPGGHLAYVFGWAPLFSDLAKFIGLSKMLDDHFRHLKKMEAGEKFKRSLGELNISNSKTSDYAITYVLPKPLVVGENWVKEDHKAWFSAKAQLNATLPGGFEEQRWLAARAALGLNVSAATIWNAIPWSWLIDYFVNIGTFLDAHRGYIPWTVKSLCLMRTKTAVSQVKNLSCNYAFVHNSGGVLTTITKLRTVVANPTPKISFKPILTDGQSAILASLVTASALRKYGQ